jgi:hypothetical protein
MGSISVQKIAHYAGVNGIQGATSYYGWQNPNPVAVYAVSLELSELGGSYPKHVELSPLRYYRDATDTVVRWSVTNLTSSITYYHIHLSWAKP